VKGPGISSGSQKPRHGRRRRQDDIKKRRQKQSIECWNSDRKVYLFPFHVSAPERLRPMNEILTTDGRFSWPKAEISFQII
jgi:hypothetical protein